MADLDIAAFLRARLDEREARALAAQGTTEGRWEQDDPVHAHGLIIDDYGDFVTYDEGAPSEAQAVHIVDNDPAFVLADVAAKRQIIERHSDTEGGGMGWGSPEGGYGSYPHACSTCGTADEYAVAWPCETLRLLALPFAGHPEFREEWKP